MWKRIGIVIGGVILIWIVWFCGLAIETIIEEFLPFGSFPILIYNPLITFFSCWLVGWLAGRKIGDKGWLYGGLPVLIFAAITRFFPAGDISLILKGHHIYTVLPALFVVFPILVPPLILAGIFGGMYGEKVAKRRKTRI